LRVHGPRTDELNRGRVKLNLSFTLPPGAYATLVVRRVLWYATDSARPVLRPAQTPPVREESVPAAKARPAAERAQVRAKPQGFLARQRASKEARAERREAARKPPRR
jgi:tRNA pseudouridine13 synthase